MIWSSEGPPARSVPLGASAVKAAEAPSRWAFSPFWSARTWSIPRRMRSFLASGWSGSMTPEKPSFWIAPGRPRPKKRLKARIGMSGAAAFADVTSISSKKGRPTAMPPSPRRTVRRSRGRVLGTFMIGVRSG